MSKTHIKDCTRCGAPADIDCYEPEETAMMVIRILNLLERAELLTNETGDNVAAVVPIDEWRSTVKLLQELRQ